MDAQPAPRIEYTDRLDRARINRMPRLISTTGKGMGMGAHKISARVRASMGARRKRTGEEVEGRMGSLINSFTPSAIGWRSP